jgi:hypothetical protein
MSSRAAEYRQLLEDVIAGGLLEPDEIAELKEMIENAQRKMAADMPKSEEIARILLGDSAHG